MKKFLSLALALVMAISLVTVAASAKDFSDKSKITYTEAVSTLTGIGVIDGYTDGSFGPSGNITRGAAAKIICNLVLGPTTAAALGTTTAPFKDVPTSNTFAGYIAYCSAQGIINGYSDGTFRPSETVTGYQFLKMLLGALGYDATIEGFVGTNWSINVAKLASNLGLTKGNTNFTGNKAMTREEACLYAYNTLKATMVEYESKGQTIVVNGVTISQGASKASDVYNSTSTDGNIYVSGYTEGKDHLMQFAEKYFTDLKMTSTTDDLGRTADKWTYKGAKIGTYTSATAAVSFTASTKESEVKTALTDYSYSATAVPVYYNGKDTTAIMSNAAIAALTGNGTLVEVFTSNSVVSKVVVAQAYLGKVTSVDTKNEKITVQLNTANGTKTITDSTGYGTYVKDDYVMVVPAYATAANAPASIATAADAQDILTITAATKATGKITAVKTGKYLIMDGTTYNFAAQQVNGFTASVNNVADTDIYVDAYGYVVDCTASAASGNYLYLAKSWAATDDYGNPAIKAQAVLSDGTITTVVVSKVDTKTAVAEGASAQASEKAATVGLYRYNTSNSKYELTSTDSYMVGPTTTTIESTTAQVSNCYFTDASNMIVISGTAGTDLKAAKYTGKHTTSGSAACYIITTKASGNTISTIFVVGTDVVTSSTDLVYCNDASSKGTISAGGTNYTAYDLYVNGKSMTVASKTVPTAAKFYTYGVDTNGVYTLTEKTSGVVLNTALTSIFNSQYITITGTDLANGNYSASDAIIVDINTDDAYDFNSIGDIQTQKDNGKTINVSVAYNSDTKTVSAIYVVSVA